MDENDFSDFRGEDYEPEASFRWPEQFAESQQRLARLSKHDALQIQKLADWVNENLVRCLESGLSPHSDETQEVVGKHFVWVSSFWDPDKEAYLRLSEMYVEDERYRAFYDRIQPGLSEYLSLAMKSYANSML